MVIYLWKVHAVKKFGEIKKQHLIHSLVIIMPGSVADHQFRLITFEAIKFLSSHSAIGSTGGPFERERERVRDREIDLFVLNLLPEDLGL